MKIKIYQINQERDQNGVKFMESERLTKLQGTQEIDASLYDEVFSGEVECADLEDLYTKFELEGAPPLHRGHSLSISDVVVKEDGAFYCDLVGFSQVNFDESKTQKTDNLMKVVFVEPGKLPVVGEIEHTLEGMQRVVGGYIQCIHNDDGTIIVCNDEGKLNGLPLNRKLGDYDIIAGNFFIAGDDGEEMRSLTEEEQEKYKEKYGEKSMEETDSFVLGLMLQMKQ